LQIPSHALTCLAGQDAVAREGTTPCLSNTYPPLLFPLTPPSSCWCVAGKAVAETVQAAKDTILRPEWVTRLPEVCQRLEEEVEKAAAEGAFNFSSSFSGTRHLLYIRPKGLFGELKKELERASASASVEEASAPLKEALALFKEASAPLEGASAPLEGASAPLEEAPAPFKEASAPLEGASAPLEKEEPVPVDQLRGVLIWGSKGAGKNSLAKDIAYDFAFNPGMSQLFSSPLLHLFPTPTPRPPTLLLYLLSSRAPPTLLLHMFPALEPFDPLVASLFTSYASSPFAGLFTRLITTVARIVEK
jgi:hypothetical protein